MAVEKYGQMADEQLIRRLRDGDSAIVDYIMEKYKNVVKRKAKAMYLLGGENDDLIQEGMIGLFKAVRDYDTSQEASFASFADLCVSRQMYSAIEASRRKKHMPLNSYISIYEESDSDGGQSQLPLVDTIQAEAESDPEALLLGREYIENVEAELQEKLSDLEKRVLYLHLQGIDYQTIARLIDKSPKAIDNALQRIRAKAGEIMGSTKRR